MFIVGQNNPNVGNDRRQQLLQQLVQQAAQKAGGIQQTGDQGFTNLQALIAERRRMAQRTPSSAPSRGAGAGRPTAGVSLLNAAPLPTGVAARMGIGGNSGYFHGATDGVGGGAPYSISQPGRVSGLGHLSPAGGAHLPGPGGTVAGTGPGGLSYQGAPMQAMPGGPEVPSQTTTASGQVVGMSTLVPLGNGMYLDPNTGAIRGGGALPMGGGPRLVGKDAGF